MNSNVGFDFIEYLLDATFVLRAPLTILNEKRMNKKTSQKTHLLYYCLSSVRSVLSLSLSLNGIHSFVLFGFFFFCWVVG